MISVVRSRLCESFGMGRYRCGSANAIESRDALRGAIVNPIASASTHCYPESMGSEFELIGSLTNIEVIAVNLSIRELRRLKDEFGGRRWRKLKGVGLVRFPNGEIRQAELHWYEAHGIGRRKMKIKRVLD